MPYHTYVSNSGSTHLSHFLLDESTGVPAARDDFDLGRSPGALATSPDQTLLYVCLRSAKAVATLAVDKRTGTLTHRGDAPLPGGPPYIHVDRSGRFLMAAYYGDTGVSVHAIEDDGTVGEQVQWVETDVHPHSIQTDPTNRFVFVPHTNPTNAIFQFRFDAASGELTPSNPPKVQPSTEEGPRHFTYHPLRDLLYSVNENGCTVSAFHLDPQAGTLDCFQLASTLPPGVVVDEGMTTAEIEITPDGRWLIASNRGHNTLAVFAVAEDGRLTWQACYPTEPVPRFFALDPTGHWVLSAGQRSNCLVSYRIDGDTGVLERRDTYPTGVGPMWIQFVARGQ